MFTLKDIAREAGVSAMTVSNILNRRNKETRPSDKSRATRVRQIAQRLNYVPNASARAMRSRCSRQVGVLLINSPQSRFSFPDAFEEILGINESLQPAGYSLGLVRIDDLRGSDLSQFKAFTERLYDGMIVLGSMPEDVIAKIRAVFRNIVWVESDFLEPRHCIRRDELNAGILAAGHAVRNGYRRILWFATEVPPGQTDLYAHGRLAGIRKVAKQHKIEFQSLELPTWFSLAQDLGPLPEVDRYTCVISRDASYANRFAHVTAGQGVIAGVDYGLISCESSFHFRFSWPQLCHVDSDRFGMGVEAAKMMLDELGDSDASAVSHEVKGKLIEGGTAPACGDGSAKG
jgi:DNA-binding LacI/PurR family transcriptional regulator